MEVFIRSESEVAKEFKESVIDALKAVYSKIRPTSSGFIDLYLFKRSWEMDSHIRREASELGLDISMASFSTYHWAWRGWPCISVCQEYCESKEEEVWIGEVEHEAGHSILHGEPMYYIFSPPLEYLELAKTDHFSKETINRVFYYITLAVKDYEVSRMLEEFDFIERQVAMHYHHLKTPKDEEPWNRSVGFKDIQAETLVIVDEFKVLSSSKPFLGHSEEIRSLYEESIERLSPRAKRWVLEVLESLDALGESTHRNVDGLAIRIARGILHALSMS